MTLACAALLGVCGLLLSPRLPTNGELAAASVVALACACLRISRPAAVLVAAFSVAALDARARLADWLPKELETETLSITGVVDSVPQRRADGVRFEFALDPRTDTRLPRRVELSWYDLAETPQAAERWSLDVRLRRPRGFANPGGSDLAGRLLRERIGATGYVKTSRRVEPLAGDAWRRPVLRLRARLADAIRTCLGDRAATGIVVGLAVGLQDAVSAEQWRVLSRSGTSHLMAISGLHIGMVAALFAWLGAACQRWRQRRGAHGCSRDVAVVMGTVAAGGYAALAGASVPTLRTTIMIAAAAALLLRRRETGTLHVLALALVAVLLVDPLAPLASGFWLSFGTVLAIIAGLAGSVVQPSALTTYLRTQAIATVAIVPMLVGAFGSVSLVSVPVNLVAIPLYTLVVVPLVLVGTAALAIDETLGRVVLVPTAYLVEVTWPLFAIPARSPAAAWSVAALTPVMWLLLVIGVAGTLAPLRPHARLAALGLIVCVCLWQPPRPAAGQARIAVLDVGQGLAVVVETHRHLLLFDTGPGFRSGSDAGQLVVLPYLSARGWRHIDRLVVSHDDSDHAGGAESIVAALPTGSIESGGSAVYGGLRPARCRRGERWSWDGVEFEWLNGLVDPRASDNDRSCVLLVSAGGKRVLLPGDIESDGERALLDRVPRADVVVVPHHGSRSSSTEAFVAATAPRWALVSAGYRNRWGFPREQVVERWRAAGATVLTTAQAGAIEFVMGAGLEIAPRPWRRHHRRFWRDE
jgi:competence protein ComEC